MAISDTAPIGRNTDYTIQSDECLLMGVHIVFQTSARDSLPTQEARLILDYVDSRNNGAVTTVVFPRSEVFIGAANVAGGTGQPLTEAAYNTLVSLLETWLDANV